MVLVTTDAALCEPVDLALVMESTYPFLLGGVSAVVQDIVQANPDRSIGIIHITWDSAGDQTIRYDVPEQVRWVQVVYQSMNEHRADFLAVGPDQLRMRSRARKRLAGEVVAALKALRAGETGPFWSLYDRGINPRTRTFPLVALLGTRELMEVARTSLASLGMPLADLFWLLRDFASLLAAVGGATYPPAAIYHAHTTGYAGIAAVMASRQNGGKVLLTEHNLYTRDTVNELLNRSMSEPVVADDYLIADVTPKQRAWMAWFIEMGRLTYPSCDAITYLYPDAIDEAAALGGRPEISRVIPNGMTMSRFDEAHQRMTSRQTAGPVGAPDYIWQLAFIARLVPIKGLADMLRSLRLLLDRGVTNFYVTVMGPANHVPQYAQQCVELASELGLNEYVSFVGPQKVDAVIHTVDVLLLPSHNEGQPMSVLEAMTVGIPVVGTTVGGMRQVALDPIPSVDGPLGACGLLVAPHDLAGFADALQDVLGDSDLYLDMQSNARKRVQATFQLSHAMKLYRDLYQELEGPSGLTVPLVRQDQPAWTLRPAHADLPRTANSVPGLPARDHDQVIDLTDLTAERERFSQEVATDIANIDRLTGLDDRGEDTLTPRH